MNLLTVWNSRRTDRTSSQASPLCSAVLELVDAIVSFMPEHDRKRRREQLQSVLYCEPICCCCCCCPISSGAHGGNDWKPDRSRTSGGWHHLVHTHTHTGPLPISWASGTLDRRPPNKRM
jgi:hypothetical protein